MDFQKYYDNMYLYLFISETFIYCNNNNKVIDIIISAFNTVNVLWGKNMISFMQINGPLSYTSCNLLY